MKEEIIKIEGMHCSSCEILMKEKVGKIKGVKNVNADSNKRQISLQIDDDIKKEDLNEKINEAINEYGYKVEEEDSTNKSKQTKEKILAFYISSAFFVLFIILQKRGITNILNISQVTIQSAFLIGIVASISSCMAVVGTLVLTLSTQNIYKKHWNIITPGLFHISRIITFLVLGGLLGWLGNFLIISNEVYLLLNIVLFFVMLILGINLLEISPFLSKLQPRLPKFLTKGIFKTNKFSNIATPLFLGFLTFFLPCGFTQSMQFSAIATGNVFNAALIMLSFSLGTLPVLLLISFGSVKIAQLNKSKFFLFVAGFLIIFFSLFNIYSLLISSGIISPII